MIKAIQTKFGEILKPIETCNRDFGAYDPVSVFCYKCEDRPNLGTAPAIRYIPVRDVVAIQDKDGTWFDVRKD